MNLTESLVEIAKYVSASGVVGIAGVLLGIRMNNRHDLQKESSQNEREQQQHWAMFQRDTIVELQDTMWQVIEMISRVETEAELVRMDVSSPLEVRPHLDRLTGLVRRIEILAARIEDETLRNTAESLRNHAYQAMPTNKKDAGWNQPHIDRFTEEYNKEFRDRVRFVLRAIISNKRL